VTENTKFDTMIDDVGTTINNKTPLVIYILYLSSLVLGVTSIIGLVMAYLNKANATPLEQSHYRYQIRTFWIGLLYCVIGMILSLVFIGFIVLFATLIWYVVRSVKGLMLYNNGKPVENPTTWMF
jgi:Predicted membrane protein